MYTLIFADTYLLHTPAASVVEGTTERRESFVDIHFLQTEAFRIKNTLLFQFVVIELD